MNVLHVKWNLTCPITVHLFLFFVSTNTQKYKITSMKTNYLGGHPVALVGQVKDFHQHHIWCFPLPCTGKNLLECRTHPLQWSAVMSSHAASMASHRDIWSCDTLHLHYQIFLVIVLWAIYIYMLPNLIGYSKWLIQIVLQLEVICQFSRHYKQYQCQIFREFTCVFTNFW